MFGQRKLLKWSVPGVAHFLTFWGFIVLILTIVEACGALFDRDFAFPLIGRWPVVGFVEDLFAVGVLVGLVTSPSSGSGRRRHAGSAAVAVLRLAHPRRLGDPRDDRAGHRDAAAATAARRSTPGTSRSTHAVDVRVLDRSRRLLHPLGERANERIETSSCSRSIAVILAFLVIVVYSKHLHIALAPLNVARSGCPTGSARCCRSPSSGKPIDFEDAEPTTTSVRPRQGRGLHLEGHARLRDLHRVRSLPVAVPGLEHRQAAVAEARDHGPARPPVREGAVPPRPVRRSDRGPGVDDAGADGAATHVPEAGFRRVRGRARRRPCGRWSAPPRRAA